MKIDDRHAERIDACERRSLRNNSLWLVRDPRFACRVQQHRQRRRAAGAFTATTTTTTNAMMMVIRPTLLHVVACAFATKHAVDSDGLRRFRKACRVELRRRLWCAHAWPQRRRRCAEPVARRAWRFRVAQMLCRWSGFDGRCVERVIRVVCTRASGHNGRVLAAPQGICVARTSQASLESDKRAQSRRSFRAFLARVSFAV